MAAEGLPSTPAADTTIARREWRPCADHDKARRRVVLTHLRFAVVAVHAVARQAPASSAWFRSTIDLPAAPAQQ
jgi:hypothetical protein